MKKFHLRAAVIAFISTIALNGILVLAEGGHAESDWFGVAAWIIGWGVDIPGMLALAVFASLSRGFLPQADAKSFDLFVIAAIAIFSGAVWSVAAGFLFAKKRPNHSTEPLSPSLGGSS